MSLIGKRRGSLRLVVGPMFAGKTTMLLHYANRISRVPGNKLLMICNAEETRSNDVDAYKRFTHDGNATLYQQCCVATFQKTLEEIVVPADITHVVLDEVQFLTKTDLPYLYEQLVLLRALHVYAFGLLCDASRQIWPVTAELMRFADKIKHVRAVCSRCGAKAAQTGCVESDRSHSNPKVGGSDMYFALCNHCYTAYRLQCMISDVSKKENNNGGAVLSQK